MNTYADLLSGGGNAFPNADVVYSGSDDDEALNLSVQRYQSAEEAVASLSADADPTEVVSIPIMGMHAPAGSIPITLPRRTSPEFLRDSPEISALRCTLVSALRDPPRPAGGSWHL